MNADRTGWNPRRTRRDTNGREGARSARTSLHAPTGPCPSVAFLRAPSCSSWIPFCPICVHLRSSAVSNSVGLSGCSGDLDLPDMVRHLRRIDLHVEELLDD